MAFGISIKATGATALPLRRLWEQFGTLEASPSMVALNYPPHLTLAVYDSIPERTVREVLRSVFCAQAPIRLRFRRLAFFERPRLVFYAVPDTSLRLLEIHVDLHRQIEQALCQEHYRPDNWVPHCTLADQVSSAHELTAKTLAGQAMEPFEVVFDAADCVEFYPVRLIDEMLLIEPSR